MEKAAGMCDHYIFFCVVSARNAMNSRRWPFSFTHVSSRDCQTAYNADSASPQPPLNARRDITQKISRRQQTLNSRIRIRNEQRHGRESESSLALCFFFFVFCVMYRESREPQKKRGEKSATTMRYGRERARHTLSSSSSPRTEKTHFQFQFFSSLPSLLFFSISISVYFWSLSAEDRRTLARVGWFFSVSFRAEEWRVLQNKQGIPRKSFGPRQERNSAKIIFLAWAQLREISCARSRLICSRAPSLNLFCAVVFLLLFRLDHRTLHLFLLLRAVFLVLFFGVCCILHSRLHEQKKRRSCSEEDFSVWKAVWRRVECVVKEFEQSISSVKSE